MKKHGKANTLVMLALAAVLIISLCYLSSQGVREGYCDGTKKENCKGTLKDEKCEWKEKDRMCVLSK
jgi:hypothetical protein